MNGKVWMRTTCALMGTAWFVLGVGFRQTFQVKPTDTLVFLSGVFFGILLSLCTRME